MLAFGAVNIRTISLGVLGSICLVAAAHAGPRDFTTDVRAVFAVAACGEAAPATYDAAVVAEHCKQLAVTKAQWRKNWLDKASPWFAERVAGAPSSVVYPFGGGDVITLLAVYPDATEYTSMSLEGMGDPRPLAQLQANRAQLAANLGKLRKMLAANLGWAWNTTIQLSIDSSESGSGIPGILAIALVALDAHGYEPLEARYFELGRDGSPRYLTTEQLEEWDRAQPRGGKRKKTHDLQQGAFTNLELTFRKKGDARAPKKVLRHIAADLSDGALEVHGGPLAYLAARKELGAMTKAASYLLWKPEFGKLRESLLTRMKIMVSDDTGIPPRYAKPAGFRQETFGAYHGTFFKWADQAVAKEMIELWRGATSKTIPFRFGYYDNRRNPHVMITRK